jgi:formylglycine-generating enzyme required for sulfatase activity
LAALVSPSGALAASTVKAAKVFAAGQAAGMVPARPAALAEGVVRAMGWSKSKAAGWALVVALLCGGLAVQPDPHRSTAAPAPGGSKRSLTNSIGMKLVRIPAGTFLMGAPAGETGGRDEEVQHAVEITRAFSLGVYEVTQAQYRKVMGTNPSWFCASGTGRLSIHPSVRTAVQGNTGDFPVENVSWDDAVAFCKKLSAWKAEKAVRRVYRLPSEAEWEYACRAGAREYTPFHYGKSLTSKQANFDGSEPFGGAAKGPYLARSARVGSYKPNAWGLHDMHGNVSEWCADGYARDFYRTGPRKDPTAPTANAGGLRMLRGGSWDNAGVHCRSAYRGWASAWVAQNHTGFRVACDVGGRGR